MCQVGADTLCCAVFAQLIAAQAAEAAAAENKNTIAPEHISKALEALGFPQYVPAVEAALAEVKTHKSGACLLQCTSQCLPGADVQSLQFVACNHTTTLCHVYAIHVCSPT